MPCGCSEGCDCLVTGTNTTSVTGNGSAGSPYQVSVIADPDGGLQAGATGVGILLDPAPGNQATLSAAGLYVASTAPCVTDSDSIDFSLPAGCVSGDVILDADGGLVTTPGQGVGIQIDPAGGNTSTLSAAGLFTPGAAASLATPDMRVYTSSATGAFGFEKALYPNMRGIKVRVVGAGGGSGGCEATVASEVTSGAGGGGGGYSEEIILEGALAAFEDVLVGVGGAGGAAGINDGAAGGSSSFGTVTFLSASGGGGGTAGSATASNQFFQPGSGGVGAGGDFDIEGSDGGFGASFNGLPSTEPRTPWNSGGASALGGAARGSVDAAVAGKNYGGGAGGPTNAAGGAARPGADGAGGIVIVEILV